MRYALLVLGLIWGCDSGVESDPDDTDGGAHGELDGEVTAPDGGDGDGDGDSSAPMHEGGAPDDGGDPPADSGGPSPDASDSSATIVRTLPEGDRVFVRGVLRLQFVVEGDVEQVEVRIDGEVIARVPAPFAYDLDTTTLPEGEVEVVGVSVSDSEIGSDPLAVVIDRTPPVVVERAPVPNAPSVWCRERMRFQLSEPIVASTISASSVRIGTSEDALLDATLTVSSDGREVAFELNELPDLPATLTVNATSAIEDLAGNALTPDSWSFAMPVWADVPAADGEDDPHTFGFVITEGGEQFVSWVADDMVPQVARRTTGAWTALPEWTEDAPAAPDAMRMVLAATGQPAVAYIRDQEEETFGGVPTVVRWNGTDWDELGSPDEADAFSAPLFLQLDGTTGDLFVAARTSASGYSMLTLWRVNDAGWTLVDSISMDSYWNGIQAFVALPDGSVLAGGRVSDTCGLIKLTSSWSGFVAPSVSIGTCMELHIAVDPDGVPFVLLNQSTEDTWRYKLGVHPSMPSQPYWFDALYPFADSDPEDVAFDADGRMLLVSRGSTYVSGLVVADWGGENGQVIGSWPSSVTGELELYEERVPALMRLVSTSSPMGTRYDLMLALKNQL